MRSLIVFAAIIVALVATLSLIAADDKFQAGDFVKEHLNSIGPEQARDAVKNRGAGGTVIFELVTGGTEHQEGKEMLVSEGDKLVSLFDLPNHHYPGERFVSNGKKVYVAETAASVHSALGEFVMVHNEILTEGLWGGTLSTAWALAHIDERRAKLEDRGLKKVDGRDLHRVDYLPKKPTDLQIELYFEPDTFRHVMTVYSAETSPSMSHSRSDNLRQGEKHYRLEERFADFKTLDNLSLPSRWTIQFSSDAAGRYAAHSDNKTYEFDVTETAISDNIQVNPQNFEVK
jgi:hypothetical protein